MIESKASLLDAVQRLADAPIVLRGNRAKPTVLLVACLAFLLLVAAALARGETEGWSLGLAAFAIFGGGAAFAAAQIARPPVMTVARDGLTVATLFGTRALRWDEIERFVPYRIRTASPAAAWAASEMAAYVRRGAAAPSWLGRFRRDAHVDGVLGTNWPLPARDLVEVLNAARAEALKGTSSP